MHIFRLLLFLCISLHCASSAFALEVIVVDPPQKFVWTANPLQGTPNIVEMSPTQLAPAGTSPSAMRSLLARVLGPVLGGVARGAGIVYTVMDLENGRQSVAYAIDQLMKNGQPVTPQTIHEWIAQQNGINTDPVDSTTPTFTDPSHVAFNNNLYSVTPLLKNSPEAFTTMDSWIEGPVGNQQLWIYNHRVCGMACQYYYDIYKINDTSPLPPAFDPANYPDLFGPDVYPSRAIDALVKQGLNDFDLVLTKVNDDLPDAVVVDIQAVKEPDGNTEWTEVYSNGKTYKIPIGATGGYKLPKLQPVTDTVNIQTDKGTTTLSKEESQPFIDNGVPKGATITKIDPITGAVEYNNPSPNPDPYNPFNPSPDNPFNPTPSDPLNPDPVDPKKGTSKVPPATASRTTNTYNVYNTYNNSTKQTHITERLSVDLPEVEISGSIDPKNGSIEPVTPDRISASKQRFLDAWNNLKVSVEGLFTVNLSGTGQLPIWHWLVLGKTVTIDFNQFDTQLNWLSLAFVFFSTLGALFLVFGK